MGSNFHYSIDLNEDQNHHEEPLFYPLGSSSSHLHNHQVLSNSLSSTSSILSLSSYLPFLINSEEDQHVAYNNTYHADHVHLSQPLKAKMLNGGSSSSYDHMVPKKETRLKLTIRKKDHHEDQTDFLHQNPTKPNSDSDKWMMSSKMRLIKNTITNNKQSTDHTSNNNNDHKDPHTLNQKTSFEEYRDEDLKKVSPRTTTDVTMENRYNTINENGYNNNNGVIRVCSDCSTTKTPLWRGGPRGPKSLCNACGIRQRKARRAAMAAATATGDQEVVAARMQHLSVKKKLQNKKKRSNGGDKYNNTLPVVANTKKCKINEGEEDATTVGGDSEISKSTTSSDSSVSSNKLCFDDLTIMLSKSSAYQQVFPQDEKEAAVLLMALSYGMVHG
ncbi:GATA transcription factor 21 [Raphanus sativus]|uniref:GATA transcription factor 21 n=1 Tax=Raphanus sativus TaxID=3726 RepID=A0A6J0MQD8_RAPSA|nr:GATA transcription factor 21 [Raphanus sativus]KAJ4907762.1 GATA transcription factor 21 [Raphanus sativus]